MSGKTEVRIDYDPLENIRPVESQTWSSVQTAESEEGALWKTAQYEDSKVEDATDAYVRPRGSKSSESFSTPVLPSGDGLMVENKL